MWTYLEKLLGKSSRYYENLMNSRDQTTAISETTMEAAENILKPFYRIGYSLKINKESIFEIPIPTNSKQLKIPYEGTILHPKYKLDLFIDLKKYKDDATNIALLVNTISSGQGNPDSGFPTLPIWEELIHYHNDAHHKIVSLAPSQPWTLYKKTKEKLVGKALHNQISGYPQWLVNDIDFRKIASKEFLFQMELEGSNQILYYFMDPLDNSVEFFIQTI